MNTSTLISYGKKISRDDLALIPTPDATRTHQPIPHHGIVQSLIETLSFRHIGVLKDEYAVSGNGMKCLEFWIWKLDLKVAASRSEFATVTTSPSGSPLPQASESLSAKT